MLGPLAFEALAGSRGLVVQVLRSVDEALVCLVVQSDQQDLRSVDEALVCLRASWAWCSGRAACPQQACSVH